MPDIKLIKQNVDKQYYLGLNDTIKQERPRQVKDMMIEQARRESAKAQ